MPLIIGKSFAFIHVGKTGGTSIVSALYRYRDLDMQDVVKTIPTHCSAQLLIDRIGHDAYSKLFVFGTARHPAARTVSYFESLRRTQDWPGTFNEFVKMLTVNHRCSKKCFRHGAGCLAVPQAVSLCDSDWNVIVDRVLRYERLGDDFHDVCTELGIQCSLKNLNASIYEHDYAKYYDDETRDLVSRYYAIDFQLWNYTWDNLND